MSDTIVKTGTTTVALTTDEGVLLAADRRASLGGRFVSNKNVQKVQTILPTAALTMAGGVGDLQAFIRTLRAEASLYETRRDHPIDMAALSTLAGNLFRNGPYRGGQPTLGGVDATGAHIYSLDGAGGVMEDDYIAAGSGMQLAYGVLEREYDPDLSLEGARRVAANAVESAVQRDTASGNGVTIATVTGDGVEIRTYDEFAEVTEVAA
ncbi:MULTISPECIES: proteasome subunit beta [unclassified Haladaptatus]|uniref:proteasome subunit beta n=1 Tax=unclassified Haladaptatus TaxID=2622732 RepID=UPI00209C6210|nr:MULTISPECIES: proteasome subunit beta [unclassified Haladaptatus]MCO8245005.1 proteasome subunit beta [Haladaptatus sp. AB643]MCO8253147.1 proteasome subunit beta [Haladaptatus sp. AB618]